MKKQLIKSKYELHQLINEDIISFCYEGITHYSDVPILIWKYKKDYLDASLITTLINHSEQLIQLSHPHLLRMIDYHYDGDCFYTIHENPHPFMCLDTYLKKQESIDLKQLWTFSTNILNLLLELEQRKLICGSINFSNLVVTSESKVMLSRSTLPIDIYKKNYNDLSVIEDCIFLAPEFILNTSYTRYSDMYSYGILLYSFFSQKWPYKYSIKLHQMKKELVSDPLEFEPAHAKIPDQVGKIIRICLHADPENRFRSFIELIKVYRGDTAFQGNESQVPSNVQQKLQHTIKEKTVNTYTSIAKYFSALLVFALIVVVMHNIYLSYITSIPEVVVPNLVNMKVAEAETLLKQQQLRSLIAGARFHPNIPKDFIIESKPPGSRIVKENRIIRLFISKGIGPVLVPDLVGYTKESIETLVDDQGLHTEIMDEQYSLHYEKGSVIGQIPGPNTFIGPSENIKLILSKGYPVDITIKKAKPSFFQDKSHLRRVFITSFLLKEWPEQDISIIYKHDEKQETIYSDLIKPGESLDLEFELHHQGNLEIYFNNELTLKKQINDSQNDSAPQF